MTLRQSREYRIICWLFICFRSSHLIYSFQIICIKIQIYHSLSFILQFKFIIYCFLFCNFNLSFNFFNSAISKWHDLNQAELLQLKHSQAKHFENNLNFVNSIRRSVKKESLNQKINADINYSSIAMLNFKITVALREIKKYQKSALLLILRISFQRVVRKISHEITIDQNFRFQVSALKALQKITKTFMIMIFKRKWTLILLLLLSLSLTCNKNQHNDHSCQANNNSVKKYNTDEILKKRFLYEIQSEKMIIWKKEWEKKRKKTLNK